MAMEKIRAELAKFKEESAKEARKAKIEREVAKYSNKATHAFDSDVRKAGGSQ